MRIDRPKAFMAECFWPGVTEQQVADAGARARRVLRASDAASARYVGSILVPADEIAFCLFEAESLEAACLIGTNAAIPFERMLEIVRVRPTTSKKELR